MHNIINAFVLFNQNKTPYFSLWIWGWNEPQAMQACSCQFSWSSPCLFGWLLRSLAVKWLWGWRLLREMRDIRSVRWEPEAPMSRKVRKQQRGADFLWPQGENITSSQQETSVKYEGFPCLAALSGLIGWIRTAGLTGWLKHSGPKAGRSQFTQGTAVFLRVYVCTLVAACKFESLTSENLTSENITTVRKLSLRCLCCVRSQPLAMTASKYPAAEAEGQQPAFDT